MATLEKIIRCLPERWQQRLGFEDYSDRGWILKVGRYGYYRAAKNNTTWPTCVSGTHTGVWVSIGNGWFRKV